MFFLIFDRVFVLFLIFFLFTGTGTGTLFWSQSPPTVARLGGSTVACEDDLHAVVFTICQTKYYAVSAVGHLVNIRHYSSYLASLNTFFP